MQPGRGGANPAGLHVTRPAPSTAHNSAEIPGGGGFEQRRQQARPFYRNIKTAVYPGGEVHDPRTLTEPAEQSRPGKESITRTGRKGNE